MKHIKIARILIVLFYVSKAFRLWLGTEKSHKPFVKPWRVSLNIYASLLDSKKLTLQY